MEEIPVEDECSAAKPIGLNCVELLRSSTVPITFKVGSVFTSFEEFEALFERWKIENHHPFRLASFQLLQNAEDFTKCKYRSIDYRCAFREKSEANGSACGGCKASLKVNFSWTMNALFIKRLNLEHTGHVVSCNTFPNSLSQPECCQSSLLDQQQQQQQQQSLVDGNKQTTAIKIDASFNSFDDFESSFEKWKSASPHPFRIYDSKRLKDVDRLVCETLKYRYLIYRCMYYRKPGVRSRSTSNIRDMGCPAMLRLNYNCAKNALVVNIVNNDHIDDEETTTAETKNKTNKNKKRKKSDDIQQTNGHVKQEPSTSFDYYANGNDTFAKRRCSSSKLLTENGRKSKKSRKSYENFEEISPLDGFLPTSKQIKTEYDSFGDPNGNFAAESKKKLKELVTARIERNETMKTTTNNYVVPQNMWQNLWKDTVTDVSLLQKQNFLQSTGDDKLQSVDCYHLTSGDYELCRDCDTAKRAKKKVKMDACRFKNFRICDESKVWNRFLESKGKDVEEWLRNKSTNINELTPSEACYLLKLIAPEFKKILKSEKEFFDEVVERKVLNKQGTVAWKKPLQYREFCDLCYGCIFNLHLFCNVCGCAICLNCLDKVRDCSPWRKNKLKVFMCPNNYRHKIEKKALKLCQIIPDTPKETLQTLLSLNTELDAVLKHHNKVSSNVPPTQGEEEFKNCKCKSNLDFKNDPAEFNGEYYFDGELLVLNDASNENALNAFRNHWPKFRPVIVRNIDKNIDLEIWNPDNLRTLSRKHDLKGHVQNCVRSHVLVNCEVDSFWKGFSDYTNRCTSDVLKLKDWPSDVDFETQLPVHYANFCAALPFSKYTHPVNGVYSLTTHLPQNYVKPDLGPKLYCAYEMIDYPEIGTTNLHLDCGDAVNVLVNVTCPKNVDEEEFYNRVVQHLERQGLDPLDVTQSSANLKRVGALWTIFKPEDTEKIRLFLKKISPSRKRNDPIHDQMRYLDADLRQQLREEFQVAGFSFVQMLGDAVFIPAGAAHQVQNLVCCVKVAEDFVSPEHLARCSSIDSEFRQLTRQHTSHEDKLQLPNVVLHSVKEAVRVLANEQHV